jgi:hypothetical protein
MASKKKVKQGNDFEWMTPAKPAGRNHAAREDMYLAELRERAALLKRLNYDKAEARARLRANVHWDFELHSQPGFLSKIDGIIEDVYGRGGTAGGPPTL